jgi:ATP-dependent DNA helicase RecQ
MSTLHDNLKKYFGFSSFRQGQEEIVNAILSSKNTLTVLPTGGGKSLCYQLPAVMSPGFSIVISPLIALMKDQVDAMNKKTKLAGFINSTMDFRETEQVFREIENGTIKLLYVAPERLGSVQFAERIKSLKPYFLFVDEAHCISEWGHNFRPSYRKIREFVEFIELERISAFTATATPEVVRDIVEQLNFKEPKIFIRGFERENLSLIVYKDVNKRSKLLEVLSNYGTPAIIYTASRRMTEEITEFLGLSNIKCESYHAGQNAILRKHTQEAFINGKLPVIVATNAFGMGIDKGDIRLVVHYNMPGSLENYYQEIGRAGRDGKESYAVLFYDKKDEGIHQFFIANSFPTPEIVTGLYNAICDYGKVPLGHFYEHEIMLNWEYLRAVMNRSELSNAIVHASLRLLEEAGYMRLVSEFSKKPTLQFIVPMSALKNHVKTTKSPSKQVLILSLLRDFGGQSLQAPIEFNINELAERNDISEEELINQLTELDRSGIVALSLPSLGSDSAKLLSPRTAANRLNINFKKINEQYLFAQQKLDRMRDFIFTGDCRFNYILQYFSENVSDYKCNKCDNCHSPVVTDASIQYLNEIILKTLKEFEESLTELNLFNLLTGNSSSTAYKKIPQFGVCRQYKRHELFPVIHALEQQGLLKHSSQKKKNVQLTNKGMMLLIKTGVVTDSSVAVRYEENLELYNLLRELRTKAAAKFNQSIHLICSDELLREIVLIAPDTKAELMQIPGFHERMYNKFGDEVLEIINEFKLKHAPGHAKSDTPELSQNLEETYRLVKEGYPLKDIAALRKLSEAVISMQIETIIEYEPSIDITHLVREDIIEKLRVPVKNGIKDLKNLKRLFPDGGVSYPEIRIAAAKIRAS